MRSATDADHLLTPAQVAERFDISRRTVYRWVQSGYLRPTQNGKGGKLFFRSSDLDALFEAAS